MILDIECQEIFFYDAYTSSGATNVEISLFLFKCSRYYQIDEYLLLKFYAIHD